MNEMEKSPQYASQKLGTVYTKPLTSMRRRIAEISSSVPDSFSAVMDCASVRRLLA